MDSTEHASHQSIQLAKETSDYGALIVRPPGEHRRPLFEEFAMADSEPWALHLKLTATERKNLSQVYTFTKRRNLSAGSRRAPRGAKDSLIVWSPEPARSRYVELTGLSPILRGRIGEAFRVASGCYHEKFPIELGSRRLVYVAGCGRSGTTLLQRLMRNFVDTHVASGERPFTAFLDLSDRPEIGLVVKRDALAWETLEFAPETIRLVYCVRHPFDVLTSYHPGARRKSFYISPSRWRSEYLSLRKLLDAGRLNLLIVRYEDLIDRPDDVQVELGHFCSLDPAKRFSAVGEALSSRSIGKWLRTPSFASYTRKLMEQDGDLLNEFMDRFGYQK